MASMLNSNSEVELVHVISTSDPPPAVNTSASMTGNQISSFSAGDGIGETQRAFRNTISSANNGMMMA